MLTQHLPKDSALKQIQVYLNPLMPDLVEAAQKIIIDDLNAYLSR